MRSKRQHSIRTDRALSIDQISPGDIASLVAFWKCDETSGNTIYDHSGNDLHLTIQNTSLQSDDFWQNYHPGWATVFTGLYPFVNVAGTRLDTQNKCIVWAAELYLHGALGDLDAGTANDFTDSGTYEGFMLGGHLDQLYVRCATQAPAVTTVGGAQVAVPTKTAIPIVGGFLPSSRVTQCINKGARTENATTIASLVAQNGRFAFGPSQAASPVSIRNYMVFTFDTEPSHFDGTVEWLCYNPGKIPDWII